MHTVGLESAIFHTASLCACTSTFWPYLNMHYKTMIDNMFNILHCVFCVLYAIHNQMFTSPPQNMLECKCVTLQ